MKHFNDSWAIDKNQSLEHSVLVITKLVENKRKFSEIRFAESDETLGKILEMNTNAADGNYTTLVATYELIKDKPDNDVIFFLLHELQHPKWSWIDSIDFRPVVEELIYTKRLA